ncbi:MurR/RpiR family transcriptional regulator [Brevibacillus sp. NRS-1366]|uniref:MurR/RpiR family transcriptional regulator n=1 Tax=Brevibacillus sp. NRS-1366 TaxID=3233899 RepID=UPI003D197363
MVAKLKEQYESLSDGQKKVAKIIFENPSSVAFSSALEIGKQTGVSESTVIRLTQTLGYKGYAELQEMIKHELKKGRTLSQYQEISSMKAEQSFVKQLMSEDIHSIQRTMDSLHEEEIKRAVEMISKAERIFITASLYTSGLAHLFSDWMNVMLQNTELMIPHSSQFYSQLSRVNQNTLVIPVTFPRYTQSTVDVVKYVKERGAKVISITDSELSPVANYSDIVLISVINSEIKSDSYVSCLSLITSLIRAVTVENTEKVEKNLLELEKIYKDNHVFYHE